MLFLGSESSRGPEHHADFSGYQEEGSCLPKSRWLCPGFTGSGAEPIGDPSVHGNGREARDRERKKERRKKRKKEERGKQGWFLGDIQLLWVDSVPSRPNASLPREMDKDRSSWG